MAGGDTQLSRFGARGLSRHRFGSEDRIRGHASAHPRQRSVLHRGEDYCSDIRDRLTIVCWPPVITVGLRRSRMPSRHIRIFSICATDTARSAVRLRTFLVRGAGNKKRVPAGVSYLILRRNNWLGSRVRIPNHASRINCLSWRNKMVKAKPMRSSSDARRAKLAPRAPNQADSSVMPTI
jgi:hypothetical protein